MNDITEMGFVKITISQWLKSRSNFILWKTLRSWLAAAVLLTLILGAGIFTAYFLIVNEEAAPYWPDSSTPWPPSRPLPDKFRHAAVACDSALCSTVGKQILLEGGNAVDSAIATLLCNGLTAAQSMGIGGGFFMTIYNRTSGFQTTIDAREVAPDDATADMFDGHPEMSSTGGLSVAVPGEIKGYWYVHQKYGRRPWSQLFQPTIELATRGFPVPIGLSDAIKDDVELLTTEPSLRAVFFNNETGELFKEGEIMRRPQLAETLRAISEEGMSAFYDGSLTDDILKDLSDIANAEQSGSIIDRGDLADYEVVEKPPLEITLDNGLRMISPPPPSGGAILAFILNILDGYKFSPESIRNNNASTLTYHRIVEAFKFAYAKRTDLGDEDYIDVDELVKNLTSKAYADEIRSRISDTRTYDYMYYGPTYYDKNTTGTSHLSVLDQGGSAVSVTSTINGRFGCKRRGVRTGIIFNNEMDDFSSPNITNDFGLRPSPANRITPGKRPLSSMCPAVFISPRGDVAKVLGAAGGSKITTAVAWVATHNIWLGKNIREAIESRRLHHQLLPPWIQYEDGFSPRLVSSLAALGHNVTEYKLGGSIIQGIDVEDGTIYANCDFRKGGKPDGF